MPLIECIPGQAETCIAGNMYSFQQDAYGRYVCRVDRFEHMACLLATPHYRQVPDVPEQSFQKASAVKEVAPVPAMDPTAVPAEPGVLAAQPGLVAALDPDGNPPIDAAPAVSSIGGLPQQANIRKKGGRPSRKQSGA